MMIDMQADVTSALAYAIPQPHSWGQSGLPARAPNWSPEKTKGKPNIVIRPVTRQILYA